MRLLFLGDIVGRTGRAAIVARLPGLIERLAVDFTVINGENAAGGFGITEEIADAILEAGADAITLGNHAWDQREALVFITRRDRVIRPVNYPSGTPGRGANLIAARDGRSVLVINVMGRVFMDALDDPFAALSRELDACPLGVACDAAIVDVHAEATSEKQAMGYFCDGRASLVVGTHTHVPTSDHRILPHGTAYMTDAGMCGDYESVVGMDKEEPLNRFMTKLARARFEPAAGEATVSGVLVETNDTSGLATRVAPLRVGGRLEECWPAWA